MEKIYCNNSNSLNISGIITDSTWGKQNKDTRKNNKVI